MSETTAARATALAHLEKAVKALQKAGLYGDAQALMAAGLPLRRVVFQYRPDLLSPLARTLAEREAVSAGKETW